MVSNRLCFAPLRIVVDGHRIYLLPDLVSGNGLAVSSATRWNKSQIGMFFNCSSPDRMLPELLTNWHCWHPLTTAFTSLVRLCQKYLRRTSANVRCSPKCPKSSCIRLTKDTLSSGLGTSNALKKSFYSFQQ